MFWIIFFFEFHVIIKGIGILLTQQNNNNKSKIIWLTSDITKEMNDENVSMKENWNQIAVKGACCEIDEENVQHLKRARALNDVDKIENPKQKLSFLSCSSLMLTGTAVVMFLSCVAYYKSVNFVIEFEPKMRDKNTPSVVKIQFWFIWFSGKQISISFCGLYPARESVLICGLAMTKPIWIGWSIHINIIVIKQTWRNGVGRLVNENVAVKTKICTWDTHKAHISQKQVTTKSLWLTHESLDSNQSRNASNVQGRHMTKAFEGIHNSLTLQYKYAIRTCKSNRRHKNITSSNRNIQSDVSLGSFQIKKK